MMMIICFSVKLITIHTWIQKKILFNQNLFCRDFHYTLRLRYPEDNLKFAVQHMYHHIHTLTINYMTTQNNMQI